MPDLTKLSIDKLVKIFKLFGRKMTNMNRASIPLETRKQRITEAILKYYNLIDDKDKLKNIQEEIDKCFKRTPRKINKSNTTSPPVTTENTTPPVTTEKNIIKLPNNIHSALSLFDYEESDEYDDLMDLFYADYIQIDIDDPSYDNALIHTFKSELIKHNYYSYLAVGFIRTHSINDLTESGFNDYINTFLEECLEKIKERKADEE